MTKRTVKRNPAATKRASPVREVKPPSRPTVAASILLVEDEPILVSLYTSALRKLTEATVLAATEEQEALRIINRVLPRIILLDLMIPTSAVRTTDASFHEPVGFDVLRRVKANPKTRAIHVIVITNLDADEHKQRAQALGADDYLVKALLQPRELADRIAQYLVG